MTSPIPTVTAYVAEDGFLCKTEEAAARRNLINRARDVLLKRCPGPYWDPQQANTLMTQETLLIQLLDAGWTITPPKDTP